MDFTLSDVKDKNVYFAKTLLRSYLMSECIKRLNFLVIFLKVISTFFPSLLTTAGFLVTKVGELCECEYMTSV